MVLLRIRNSFFKKDIYIIICKINIRKLNKIEIYIYTIIFFLSFLTQCGILGRGGGELISRKVGSFCKSEERRKTQLNSSKY